MRPPESASTWRAQGSMNRAWAGAAAGRKCATLRVTSCAGTSGASASRLPEAIAPAATNVKVLLCTSLSLSKLFRVPGGAPALIHHTYPLPPLSSMVRRAWRVSRRAPRLRRLQRQGDALTDADAHGRERTLRAALLELESRRAADPGAGHAERVPERDRAAVRIDVCGIVREAELAQRGERLAGERLVQLDEVD